MSDITTNRRVHLHQHPAPPPGLEVHERGLRHEVQRGDSAWAIARDYSQAYHMDISASALQRANAAAFKDGLHPGELLQVPGVQERFDAFIAAEGTTTADVRHTVGRGDTLSSIARRYADQAGGSLSWRQVYDANRETIGANPNVIRPGQVLTIPGTGTDGFEVPPLRTISELDQDVVLTRVGRVQHEMGGIEQIDVVRFKADGSHAERHASVAAAITAARSALAGDSPRSNPIAVVQTRDGAAWTVPVRGEEASENLDDSDRTLSLAWRAGSREVVAVVDDPWNGPVQVRRFDR
jgi:LysM repeat protein